MVTQQLYLFIRLEVTITFMKIWTPQTLIPLWYHTTYINLNSSYLSLTAVICYSSFKPTSSTLLAPCSFIVQPVDGTNLISVWSQFRISFSGISYISNVALISSKFLSSFLQILSQNICCLLLFPSSVYIIHSS